MQQKATTDQRGNEPGLATVLEECFPEFVIDSLPCTFFVITSQMRLVRWNRNLRLLSGYSDREIGGIDAMDAIIAERREAVADAVRRAFRGETVQVDIACRAGGHEIASLAVAPLWL